MRIIDKYIVRNYLWNFLSVILAVFGLFFLVHFVERVDNFIDGKIPLTILTKYYFYQIPYLISLGLPLSGMMAGVITLTTLIRNQEFLAMTALGYSIKHIFRSILIITLISVPAVFWLNESVVIKTQQTVLKIENHWLNKHLGRFRNHRENLYFHQTPNTIITIGNYYTKVGQGNKISIQYFEDEKLIKRIDASKFSYDSTNGYWVFLDVVTRDFIKDREYITREQDILFDLFNLSPQNLSEQFFKSSEFSAWELRKLIQNNYEAGIESTELETEWHFRIAFAFTIFIITFTAIPVVILTSRGNLGIGVGLSLILTFVYLILLNYAQIIAKARILDPFWALWMVNFIFLGSGILLFFKARK